MMRGFMTQQKTKTASHIPPSGLIVGRPPSGEPEQHDRDHSNHRASGQEQVHKPETVRHLTFSLDRGQPDSTLHRFRR
jgi:hypothetical protein